VILPVGVTSGVVGGLVLQLPNETIKITKKAKSLINFILSSGEKNIYTQKILNNRFRAQTIQYLKKNILS
jgi:hypothetical protein